MKIARGGSWREQIGQAVHVGVIFSKFYASFSDGPIKKVAAFHLTLGGEVCMFGSPPFGLKQTRTMQAELFIFDKSFRITDASRSLVAMGRF